MVTVQQKVTADELLRMPDDGFRYELVKGELRKMAPAGYDHGGIAGDFHTLLGYFVRLNKLGKVYSAETGFKIASNPDTVRAPDVAFVCQARVDAASRMEGYFPGAPDLAVEVVPPNDRYTEVIEKVEEWLNAGTQMVIVVNPRQRNIAVYRALTDVRILTENDTLDGADVVPDWTLAVREVFS